MLPLTGPEPNAAAGAGEPAGTGTSLDHPPTLLPRTGNDCEGDCYYNEPEFQVPAARSEPAGDDGGDAEVPPVESAGTPPAGGSGVPAPGEATSLTPPQQEAADASYEAQELKKAQEGGPAASDPTDPDNQQGKQNPFRAADQAADAAEQAAEQNQQGSTVGAVHTGGYCDYIGQTACVGIAAAQEMWASGQRALANAEQLVGNPGAAPGGGDGPATGNQDGEPELCGGLDADAAETCRQMVDAAFDGPLSVRPIWRNWGPQRDRPPVTCDDLGIAADLCARIEEAAKQSRRPLDEVARDLLARQFPSEQADPDAVITAPVAGGGAPVADCDGQYIPLVRNWEPTLGCDLVRSYDRIAGQAVDASLAVVGNPSVETVVIEGAKFHLVALEEGIRLLTSPYSEPWIGSPGDPMWPGSGGPGAGAVHGAKPAPGRGAPASPAGTDPVDPPAGPDGR
jgi:hypothetical protein